MIKNIKANNNIYICIFYFADLQNLYCLASRCIKNLQHCNIYVDIRYPENLEQLSYKCKIFSQIKKLNPFIEIYSVTKKKSKTLPISFKLTHANIISSLIKYWSDYRYFRHQLNILKPCSVLLSSDWVDLESRIFHKVCAENNVNIYLYVSYFKLGPDPANNLATRASLTRNRAYIYFLRIFFPQYIIAYKGFAIARLPFWLFCSHLIWGLYDKRPWIAYCDHPLTFYLIDDYFIFNAYKNVFPKNKIIFAPTPLGNSKYCNQGAFSDRLIVCSVPYDASGLTLSDQAVRSYNGFLAKYFECLKKICFKKARLLFLPHPSTPSFERLRMEKSYDVNICPFGSVSSQLISEAYVYVTSSSTTIRWALCRCIPVIDFDFLDLSEDLPFSDYVFQVKTFNELSQRLQLLLDEPQAYDFAKNNIYDKLKSLAGNVPMPLNS